MSEVHFYRRCAALPFIVPLLLLPLLGLHFAPDSLGILPDPAVRLANWLCFSAVIGGVPYLAFIGLVLTVFRKRSATWYFRFSLVVPVLFATFLWMSWVAFLVGLGVTARQAFDLARLFAIAAVPTGYGYVIIVHAFRWMFLSPEIAR